jgi:hypothetical protein
VSRGKVVGALLPATVTALLLVACGGGDDSSDDSGDNGSDNGEASGSPSLDSGPDAGTSLTVEAHDIEFDRDAYRTAAGTVDVEYVQEGALPHTLLIEAPDGGDVEGFVLEVGEADADRGTVELAAGDYVVYCDVPGHRDAGMEAELRAE